MQAPQRAASGPIQELQEEKFKANAKNTGTRFSKGPFSLTSLTPSSPAALGEPRIPTTLNHLRLLEHIRYIPISHPLPCIFLG